VVYGGVQARFFFYCLWLLVGIFNSLCGRHGAAGIYAPALDYNWLFCLTSYTDVLYVYMCRLNASYLGPDSILEG